MRALVFLPDRNCKRNDYEGVFLPEAQAFASFHGIPERDIHAIPLEPGGMARPDLVLAHLASARRLEAIAIFCHGYADHLQLGFRLRNIPLLAQALAEVALPSLRIVLYAGSTGRGPNGSDRLRAGGPGGDGGFADRLRDALCRVGLDECQVDAHATAGHPSRNPYVRRFRGEHSPVGGQGGSWIVRPDTPQLWRAWSRALAEERGTLRFELPFLPLGKIHARLIAKGLPRRELRLSVGYL